MLSRRQIPMNALLLCLFFLTIPGLAMGQTPAATPESISLYEHRNLFGEPVDLAQSYPEFATKCYRQGVANSETTYTALIERLITALRQGPLLTHDLLDHAAKYGTVLCMEDSVDGYFSYFDLAANVVLINAQLDIDEQLLFVVHELRHLETAARGFCTSLEYDVKEMARLTLASEADAQAVTTLFAWQLRAMGNPEVWNTLAGLELYGDIAAAFEQEMARSGDEVSATQAAFRAWYASRQRVFSYHVQACTAYFQQVDTSGAVVGRALLPDDFFGNLCLLPDGVNYGCHLTKELKR